MRTRFAPSPTGPMHLGHAYAALVAREAADHGNGVFLLRFEDIDRSRVRPGYYNLIEEDLQWMGLEWQEEPMRQSDRLEVYSNALTALQEQGLVYPCFCTRRAIADEISRITNAPHGPEGPVYPGTCRKISADERTERIAMKTPHSWRLNCAKAAEACGQLTFRDLLHGVIPVCAEKLGDVILARRDIATSYHLAVVTDDAEQQITLVTRGEDLLSSTHIHRVLQHLLGYPEPLYLHHELVCDEKGNRLATRDKARSLASLRASGCSRTQILEKLPPLPALTGNLAGET